tara:strand:- start:90 stop:278 length:189 start_codon:yes stop_codon:yes gene_type:complete
MSPDLPMTIGVEEEYLLVDPVTRDLAIDPLDAILQNCESLIGKGCGMVSPEFLHAQLEVGTQ